MKRKALIIIAAATTLLILPYRACPQYHYLFCGEQLQMDHGGTAEDLQIIEQENINEPEDSVLWSACTNSGIYRANWDDNYDKWNTWKRFMAGKHCYGVDAVIVGWTGEGGPPPESREFVLLATYGMGVFYEYSDNGYFPFVWDRPNEQDYPDAWKHADIRDAAFHLPNTASEPPDLQDKYYVILNSAIYPDNPGIYRWDDQQHDFVRIDDISSAIHQYTHFYRDTRNPNILYVTSSKGIYKLYGPYHKPVFELLQDTIRLEDLPIITPSNIAKNLPPLSTTN